jgi:tetraacyldisaccharide 4'-kinase
MSYLQNLKNPLIFERIQLALLKIMNNLRLLLFPFALIYGAIVIIRNYLYDKKVFKSSEFDEPVIGVGNLSVGGTGKTPHIEYLIRLLSNSGISVGVLSRGYKRKSVGYLEADNSSTVAAIGDEPRQMKNKFKDLITLAVDANRIRGIANLFFKEPAPEVILLDDCFQHRPVKPGLMILLTDYHSPYFKDFILPIGNLREPCSGSKRADLIVVTKYPHQLTLDDKKAMIEELNPNDNQKVFFSTINYGNIFPLFENQGAFDFTQLDELLLITGIANPNDLVNHIRAKNMTFQHLAFGDHHQFSASDFEKIKLSFQQLKSEKKAILTTEKDAMRILDSPINKVVSSLPFYFIEIEIKIEDSEKEFNQIIIDYVAKNKRNS